MRQISSKMITPELRFVGAVARLLWPRFTLGKFKFCNSVLKNRVGKVRSRNVAYSQIFINRPDGTALRLCVFTPHKRVKKAVGLLWLHGGGYAIGIPEQDMDFIDQFMAAADCVIVSPDYTRSLDAPYPAALDDCYLALKWLKDNCETYGIAPDKLFVGGDSAGGGLCAATCLMARDKGEVNVAFQMPLYPMLDDRLTASSRQNDAPMWNTDSNQIAWQLYLGGTAADKYAAPARETDYSALPPTLTFVGSIEPFCDETVAYINSLNAADIETRFKLYEGCFHAFDMLHGIADVAKEAREFLVDGFIYACNHYSAPQE